ncbi:MAG: hypothetical protein KDE28_12490 [Anaerolineales bacterium]|nr:hypothetical protein [Anaerolineales bacterium]
MDELRKDPANDGSGEISAEDIQAAAEEYALSSANELEDMEHAIQKYILGGESGQRIGRSLMAAESNLGPIDRYSDRYIHSRDFAAQARKRKQQQQIEEAAKELPLLRQELAEVKKLLQKHHKAGKESPGRPRNEEITEGLKRLKDGFYGYDKGTSWKKAKQDTWEKAGQPGDNYNHVSKLWRQTDAFTRSAWDALCDEKRNK